MRSMVEGLRWTRRVLFQTYSFSLCQPLHRPLRGRSPSPYRGGLRLAVSQNVGDHRSWVGKNFASGDAEGTETLICQPFVTCFVAGGNRAAVVGFAIHLDRKLGFEAGKVQDEQRTGGVLLSEFEAGLPSP